MYNKKKPQKTLNCLERRLVIFSSNPYSIEVFIVYFRKFNSRPVTQSSDRKFSFKFSITVKATDKSILCSYHYPKWFLGFGILLKIRDIRRFKGKSSMTKKNNAPDDEIIFFDRKSEENFLFYVHKKKLEKRHNLQNSTYSRTMRLFRHEIPLNRLAFDYRVTVGN